MVPIWPPVLSKLIMLVLVCVLYVCSAVLGQSLVVEAGNDVYPFTDFPTSTTKPPPKLITCWTCPNKSNNEECNNWAPDKFCLQNFTVCKTVHRVNTLTGRSIAVNKMCAKPAECNKSTIGCRPTEIPYVQDCISCCDQPYCNEHAPSNSSTAILYSRLGNPASRTVLDTRWLIPVAMTTVLLIPSWRR
ncbi:ly6/PLAUR domain-containing protein 6B [Lingula anatina]|uniref:Ly6/PLAUR domain-containing protein 6B n=1 Tax=Lingula anatina TaxID=7574 RepID=A0A1S3ILR1_LINAN|nr:ly6/PLAUR domain-containing protein 6B [Lingula anatina]XP_013398823.1 ly6/PLAUR domain-containing protein 6B [Lingula anatina]XP_013398824.1 ly6/PLAUR domain-containing protein 6B [Lingula anatina]XP_013398825.1 ly6/PLAUR domain-containing protein 6B [Lingula anatina]XP_013398826.1 ly6/PLAUR domain-containing protein 6B [Lingula anatina]XP_013398827.1 ly6/PLAUR domain-containing protein 6B [Lingula anatina]XP_013398828.1 ly6/PLAUR domain-containing protein 6B [Lingula anatina]XP_01339882|eukprot:XP_013398822.1 ly6/PLAUR domain-containing protein 6B [Lingula anatina]